MAKQRSKSKVSEVEKYGNIPTSLKELAKGSDGQYIALLDINTAKANLKKLSKKYDKLKVTEENYKKEGADAERELRQTRYALQNIHKSNNAFLNDAKKQEKEKYDELIEIIEPQEKKLKEQIDFYAEKVKKAKEEEERLEKERLEKIEKALKEAEFALEKAVLQGKDREDLEEYDKFLKEFEGKFSEFEESEFQAKRLHAIYKGRRGELLQRVEQNEKAEEERKKLEDEKKANEAKRKKIIEARKEILIKKGLELSHLGTFVDADGNEFILEGDVDRYDEVEWFEALEEIDGKISKLLEKKAKDAEAEKQRKKEEDLAEMKKAREEWSELVNIYRGMGGKYTGWKLKKNEVPSQEDVEELRTEIKNFQQAQRALKVKSIQKDLKPYKLQAEQYLAGITQSENTAKLENEESREILNNYKESLKDLIKDFFGGEIEADK